MTKVVFFGNERLATGVTTSAPTLQALIANGYDVVAVVSNYEIGQSRNARSLEIQTVADQHSIPVLLPTKPLDIIDQLRDFNTEIAVLVAYGKIVPQSIIDVFPKGIINIHPSALPLRRGPIPVESVILDGSTETAVSLMKLAKEMDAGPVYVQEKVSLTGNETKQDLADKLLSKGAELVISNLPSILNDSLKPKSQDNTKATYDSLISKEDGIIDWKKPAEQIEREIRAYIEWPKSRTIIAGKDVIITKAHAIPSNNPESMPGDAEVVGNTLQIECGEGYLCIDKLKPAGKNEMASEAFLAGNRNLL